MIYAPEQLKLEVINYLRNNKERFRGPLSDYEFVMECPYCGDSLSGNHGHFYMKIDPRDHSAMKYNCFRCPAGGIVTKDVLERLGFSDASILSSVGALNRNAPMKDVMQYLAESSLLRFDYRIPEVQSHPEKLQYLEKRLGRSFLPDEVQDMKVITSLYDFLNENQIKELTCYPQVANTFERSYIGFLSFGGAYIFFRDITEKEKYKWVKYPITKSSVNSIGFYSMAGGIDPFSEEGITINLSEGVLDCLGVGYHLDQVKPNVINIAVGGKGYEKILRSLVSLGFVGKNVSVHIYADNDKVFNKKAYGDSTIEVFKKLFKERKYLYKEITVSFNHLSKDYGIPKEQISIKTYKV